MDESINTIVEKQYRGFIESTKEKLRGVHIIKNNNFHAFFTNSLDCHKNFVTWCNFPQKEALEVAREVCCAKEYLIWWISPSTPKGIPAFLEKRGFKPFSLPALYCSLPIKLSHENQKKVKELTDCSIIEQHITPSDNYYYKLCKEGIQICKGTLYLCEDQSWSIICNVETKSEFRRQGYATKLMAYILERAKRYNREYAMLIASPDAIKLYQNLGFIKAFESSYHYREMKKDK